MANGGYNDHFPYQATRFQNPRITQTYMSKIETGKACDIVNSDAQDCTGVNCYIYNVNSRLSVVIL